MTVHAQGSRDAMKGHMPRSLSARVVRAFVLALLFGLGAASASRAADPYSLGPGDLLQIVVYAGGEKQVDFTGNVSALGTITSPLLGEVKVAGLTTYEVERSMRERLRKYFLAADQHK